MGSTFDAIADRYAAAYPHKEGQIAAGDWLIHHLPAGARVLDVGCGDGEPTARQLLDAGLAVTGIDISLGVLERAGRRVPEATLILCGADEVGDSLGSFDAVVAFFSLLMISRARIAAALRGFREVLRPGGTLVLGMVEADLDDVPIDFLGEEVRVSCYLRDDLRAVVRSCGFTVTAEEYLPYAPACSDAAAEVQIFLYATPVTAIRAYHTGE
jgi:ubiquinone/menaquinone biosynthesis C-methylase UbiE